MISMARTFGAPLTVPAGSVARSTSIGPSPSAQLARHLRGEVHHVAVALERHHLVDLLGAEADDPADVVAGQVDEHDVLGELLRVLAQLGRQAPVVLVGAAPAAGAGDRPGDDLAVEQLHHRLGRRADERDLGVAQEVHVRARVDLAQHPVDVERVGVELEVEALGEHDLEDVAGEDVLLGHLDRLLVHAVGHRRARPRQRLVRVGRRRPARTASGRPRSATAASSRATASS